LTPRRSETLKNLIKVTGATFLDHFDEIECCGAPSEGVNDKVALQFASDNMNRMKAIQAQMMMTIFLFCHIMCDANELPIEEMFNEVYGIPIMHHHQLLGLAMGMAPEELAFNGLRVDCSKILGQVYGSGK